MLRIDFRLEECDGRTGIEELLAANLVEPLLQEANELTAIMVASRKSAQNKIVNRNSKIVNQKS
jgi:hypothetical protein